MSNPSTTGATSPPTTKPADAGPRIDRVILPVRPGHEPSSRESVRIFLGSGAAHSRAERIFVWSIEGVRDPSRVYEIHLLRGLPGFSKAGFAAESPNLRFAVPALADGVGRAIYNEVGQIYLHDPAELFDADLDGFGLLAQSDALTAPLLFDCARMAEHWPLEGATRRTEESFLESIAISGRLRGDLDSHWWAVDEDHFDAGSTRILHFDRLHTQPWRPFPERCIYHKSACEAVWRELETSADKAAFELFGVDTPSLAYRALLANDDTERANDRVVHARPDEARDERTREIAEALRHSDVQSVLECDAFGGRDVASRTRSSLDAEALDGSSVSLSSMLSQRGAERRVVDAVVCDRVLDRVPEQDLPWVLSELFARARRVVHVTIEAEPRDRECVERWRMRLETASRYFPEVHWYLRVERRSPDGRGLEATHRHGGCWIGEEEPRVWVLADDRPGNATQSLGLADALGWPYEIKKLHHTALAILHNRFSRASLLGIDRRRSSPLEAPWPDLVIATGRRTAPVAQWVRKQSGDQARVVVMGRKAGDDAELFDLAVTPEYCRCMPHPRRFETGAPLHRMTEDALRAAEKEWSDRLGNGNGRPRVALLVGGTSGQFKLDVDASRKMGKDVAEMVDAVGGSLWVSTSRRTGEAQTKALAQAIDAVHPVEHFYGWSPDGGENPYRGYLACADAFVLTADSESMLAEACFTGKPVYVYPLPERKSFWVFGFFRDRVLRIARWEHRIGRSRAPQRALSYLCSWLISRGFVRPTRDLNLFHDTLIARGVARRFGEPLEATGAPPLCEVEKVADRVRRIMGT